jgi:MFS family permease
MASLDARAFGARISFGLSQELWLIEAGVFLNMLGYGGVLPFEIIYLHNGRGFSLGVAGLVVGTITGIAVVVSPAAGQLIDRFGARLTAIAAGVALAAGYGGLAFAHTPAEAFAAAACAGGTALLSLSPTAAFGVAAG